MPKSVNYIGAWAFSYCGELKKISFENHDTIPTLANSNSFYNPKIIVPDALYDDWIVATNWSAVAQLIVKASEYVELNNN